MFLCHGRLLVKDHSIVVDRVIVWDASDLFFHYLVLVLRNLNITCLTYHW
jgi:hypothetical protein